MEKIEQENYLVEIETLVRLFLMYVNGKLKILMQTLFQQR